MDWVYYKPVSLRVSLGAILSHRIRGEGYFWQNSCFISSLAKISALQTQTLLTLVTIMAELKYYWQAPCHRVCHKLNISSESLGCVDPSIPSLDSTRSISVKANEQRQSSVVSCVSLSPSKLQQRSSRKDTICKMNQQPCLDRSCQL